MEYSAANGTSIAYPFSRPRNHLRRRNGKVRKEPEVREDGSTTVSSGYDKAAALMDSQRLWLPADDVVQINIQLLAWNRKGLLSPHP